jgi:hypothetical protein
MIAKARQWVNDLAQGRTATFAQIARREGKASPEPFTIEVMST